MHTQKPATSWPHGSTTVPDDLDAECRDLLGRIRPLISREAHMHLQFRGASASLANMLRTVLAAPPAVREEANTTWTASFRADPLEGLTDATLQTFVQTGTRRAELLLSRDALAYVRSLPGRDAATVLAVLFTADDAEQRALSARWAMAHQFDN